MNNYKFSDIYVGLKAEFKSEITQEKMKAFYDVTKDCSPIHIDENYAKQRGFKGRVVYGMLSASLFSTLAGVYIPGEHCLLHSVESKFAKPVFIGDVLTVKGEVTEINETFKTITIKAQIVNENNVKVTRGIIKASVAI